MPFRFRSPFIYSTNSDSILFKVPTTYLSAYLLLSGDDGLIDEVPIQRNTGQRLGPEFSEALDVRIPSTGICSPPVPQYRPSASTKTQ